MAVVRTLAGRLLGALRAAGPVTIAITVLGVVGALLVLLTEFSTIAEIEIGGAPCDSAVVATQDECRITGFEQHGGALILLGVLSLAMSYGAGRGRSKPAAVALAAIGITVLGFALTSDRQKTKETGLVERNYAQAGAKAGAGFYAELTGGTLLLLAGGVRLVAPRRREE